MRYIFPCFFFALLSWHASVFQPPCSIFAFPSFAFFFISTLRPPAFCIFRYHEEPPAPPATYSATFCHASSVSLSSFTFPAAAAAAARFCRRRLTPLRRFYAAAALPPPFRRRCAALLRRRVAFLACLLGMFSQHFFLHRASIFFDYFLSFFRRCFPFCAIFFS